MTAAFCVSGAEEKSGCHSLDIPWLLRYTRPQTALPRFDERRSLQMRQDTCFQQATAFQLIPSEDGVFFEQDGRTRFCLNAPKATSLAVSLPGRSLLAVGKRRGWPLARYAGAGGRIPLCGHPHGRGNGTAAPTSDRFRILSYRELSGRAGRGGRILSVAGCASRICGAPLLSLHCDRKHRELSDLLPAGQ